MEQNVNGKIIFPVELCGEKKQNNNKKQLIVLQSQKSITTVFVTKTKVSTEYKDCVKNCRFTEIIWFYTQKLTLHCYCRREKRSHSYKNKLPFWNHIQAVQFVISYQNRFTVASLCLGLCMTSKSWGLILRDGDSGSGLEF